MSAQVTINRIQCDPTTINAVAPQDVTVSVTASNVGDEPIDELQFIVRCESPAGEPGQETYISAGSLGAGETGTYYATLSGSSLPPGSYACSVQCEGEFTLGGQFWVQVPEGSMWGPEGTLVDPGASGAEEPPQLPEGSVWGDQGVPADSLDAEQPDAPADAAWEPEGTP